MKFDFAPADARKRPVTLAVGLCAALVTVALLGYPATRDGGLRGSWRGAMPIYDSGDALMTTLRFAPGGRGEISVVAPDGKRNALTTYRVSGGTLTQEVDSYRRDGRPAPTPAVATETFRYRFEQDWLVLSKPGRRGEYYFLRTGETGIVGERER
jgi:hypothetical protein